MAPWCIRKVAVCYNRNFVTFTRIFCTLLRLFVLKPFCGNIYARSICFISRHSTVRWSFLFTFSRDHKFYDLKFVIINLSLSSSLQLLMIIKWSSDFSKIRPMILCVTVWLSENSKGRSWFRLPFVARVPLSRVPILEKIGQSSKPQRHIIYTAKIFHNSILGDRIHLGGNIWAHTQLLEYKRRAMATGQI